MGRLVMGGIIPGTSVARDAKQLKKENRSFDKDIGEALADLDASGPSPTDDSIPDFNGLLFKKRVRNRDANKGKRDGYRIIYGLFPQGIALVAIFSKSERADVPRPDLHKLLATMSSMIDRIGENPASTDELLAEHKSD